MDNNRKAVDEGIKTLEKGIEQLAGCILPYEVEGYLFQVAKTPIEMLRQDFDSKNKVSNGR